MECGLVTFNKRGVMTINATLLWKTLEDIEEVEPSYKKVGGYGYPDKKFYWIRIGSFGSQKVFDVKQQFRREDEKKMPLPRQPRQSLFHRELSEQIEANIRSSNNDANNEEDEEQKEATDDNETNEGNLPGLQEPVPSAAEVVPSTPKVLDTPMKIKIGAARIEETINPSEFPFLSKLGVSLKTDYDIQCILREVELLSRKVESVNLRQV